MNYHNIKHDDMNNGPGLRVTLFVSGCEHHCKDCHNRETWDKNSGILFDKEAEEEIFRELSKDYVAGITFSGGDPLHENNLVSILSLCKRIKKLFPQKTIWLYTGYTWEEIFNFNIESEVERQRQMIVNTIDVLVDGEFKNDLADMNYHWAGSINQRVIDVKKTKSSNQFVCLS